MPETNEEAQKLLHEFRDIVKESLQEVIDENFPDSDEEPVKPVKYKVKINYESWRESFLNDLTTVVVLGGPAILNELTIKSGFITFVFGILSIITLAKMLNYRDAPNEIRGTDLDDVMARVRQRLAQLGSEPAKPTENQ